MNGDPGANDKRTSVWASIRHVVRGRSLVPSTDNADERGPKHAQISSTPEDLLKGAAAAATAIWKLQSRVERERREQAFEPPKWLVRQLEGAQDALRAVGIEAKGHTGEKYLPGLAVNVVAFQPQVGITFDVIAETLKPSVYVRDSLVQPADVIVSTPSAEAPPSGATPEPEP